MINFKKAIIFNDPHQKGWNGFLEGSEDGIDL